MNRYAKVTKLKIPKEKRIVCISDIHGYLDLLILLIDKIKFSCDDVLIMLGDFYTKGPQSCETLKYVINLCQKNNVYAIRGNSDWISDDIKDTEKEWIENLPHIIETSDYIFVHGGLSSNDLSKQECKTCMKNDAFMEKELAFDRYVVTGHWPTINYCHKIPCHNPIIDKEKKIISIDGGTIKGNGQLNAFIIHNNEFSFEYVDSLPVFHVEKNQPENGGTLNITWNDRFIELIEKGDEFSVCKHIKTKQPICIPNISIWSDDKGNLCAVNFSTDYYLPVNVGDVIYVEERFSNKMFAKKDGVMGWVNL
jgi:protein phosphatase